MATVHKTSNTFAAGSMTFSRKYHTSVEVFEWEQERNFHKIPGLCRTSEPHSLDR